MNNNGWIRIGVKTDTKTFDAQIAKLEHDLKTMVKTLRTDSQVDVKIRMSKEERLQLENDIEKVKNRIESLKAQKDKMQDEPVNFSNMEKGFNGLLTSAKRLIGGIIGIRAAYGLVRRAAGSYMATDEKLTSKMEANWIGLGAILSPIIEMIVSGLRKIVTGVLYFAQCLTGVNFIAKANEALLRKQTTATKKLRQETQRLTASFDEMNVLQDSSSSGDSGGVSSIAPSLFDISELSENTRRKIENIAKALEPIYKFLKEIVRFAIDHPEVIMAILGGAALLKFLSGIIGAGGIGGSGLLGILGILGAIAAIGVITISIKTIYEDVKKAQENNDKLIQGKKEQLEETKKQTKEDSKRIDTLHRESKEVNDLFNTTKKYIGQQKNYAYVATENTKNTSKFEKAIDKLTGTNKAAINQIVTATQSEYQRLLVLKKLYDQGKLSDKQTEEYAELLADFSIRLHDTSEEGELLRLSFMHMDGTRKITGEGMQEFEKMLSNTDDAMHDLGLETGTTTGFIQELTNPKGYKINMNTKELSSSEYIAEKVSTTLKRLASKVYKATVEIDVKQKQKITSALGAAGAFIIQNPTFLARGGIVNNPGRGVSIGNNIFAGEAGPEAVLPLDDKTLASLGKMIANNMIINLTNINQMNGRVISRELERVRANEDFAYNR